MTKIDVPMELHLLPHNGVAGSKPVAPYGGDILPLSALEGKHPHNALVRVGLRLFTYSDTVVFDTNGFYAFRESVTTKPSKWALEREAARANG